MEVILLIKKERKETYYTTDVIVDVLCDNCGKSLANDDDYINRVAACSLYYLEERTMLGSSEFYDYNLDLCDECYKPIKDLLENIDNKAR